MKPRVRWVPTHQAWGYNLEDAHRIAAANQGTLYDFVLELNERNNHRRYFVDHVNRRTWSILSKGSRVGDECEITFAQQARLVRLMGYKETYYT